MRIKSVNGSNVQTIEKDVKSIIGRLRIKYIPIMINMGISSIGGLFLIILVVFGCNYGRKISSVEKQVMM